MEEHPLTVDQLREKIRKLDKRNRELESLLDKKVEAVLERNSFYEHILDHLPSDLVAFDPQHRYLYINPVAIRDQDLRAWMIGKTDFDYCKKRSKPISIAEERKRMFQDLLSNKKEVSFEEKMISPEGQEVWNLRRMYPVLDENNEVLYVVGYASNISYLKEMEIKLEEEQKKALVSYRSKQDFIANMSHEIRTPMNAILGMSSLLQEAGLEGKYEEYLNAIQVSSKNLLVVINDILDFSKLNANKVKLELIPVCIQKQMEQLDTLFQVKSSSKDISFEITVDSVLKNQRFLMDPVRISQVLNNLVSNAIKFTEEGRVEVKITGKEVAERKFEICFEVHDTGIGIAEEHIEKIITPFSQADSSTTRKYGGTGLGLAITNDLVTLMGGQLEIESVLEQGSVFKFYLEVGAAEGQEQCFTPGTDQRKVNVDGLRFLLVEDNPINQLFATVVLEEFAESYKVANNGKEAIDILAEGCDFDVVLMDIQMPIMGGLECTDYIRKKMGLSVPIVALTANAFKEDEERYLKSGMNGYISKPFQVEDFKKVIFNVIHQE